MRAILFTITGAVLLVSIELFAAALTPQQCDQLGQWVYDQADSRDNGASRKEHEDAVKQANQGVGADIVAMLLRELGKVYADAKPPLIAAMEARYECYARKGEIGTAARWEGP